VFLWLVVLIPRPAAYCLRLRLVYAVRRRGMLLDFKVLGFAFAVMNQPICEL
jgi:hypothetical protein